MLVLPLWRAEFGRRGHSGAAPLPVVGQARSARPSAVAAARGELTPSPPPRSAPHSIHSHPSIHCTAMRVAWACALLALLACSCATVAVSAALTVEQGQTQRRRCCCHRAPHAAERASRRCVTLNSCVFLMCLREMCGARVWLARLSHLRGTVSSLASRSVGSAGLLSQRGKQRPASVRGCWSDPLTSWIDSPLTSCLDACACVWLRVCVRPQERHR